jgi:hypothetical protein
MIEAEQAQLSENFDLTDDMVAVSFGLDGN